MPVTGNANAGDAAMPLAAKDAIALAHRRWWDGLLSGDAAALDALLADDLTFHSPYGTASAKATFVGNLRTGRLGYDAITDDAPLIRMYGQAAIVTGRADIDFRWEGNPKREALYYTAVYAMADAGWRLHAWQSTLRADTRG